MADARVLFTSTMKVEMYRPCLACTWIFPGRYINPHANVASVFVPSGNMCLPDATHACCRRSRIRVERGIVLPDEVDIRRPGRTIGDSFIVQSDKGGIKEIDDRGVDGLSKGDHGSSHLSRLGMIVEIGWVHDGGGEATDTCTGSMHKYRMVAGGV